MLQELAAVDTHPLAATAARYVGLLPLLPLAGFLVNGALSLMPAYKAGPSDPSRPGTATSTAPLVAHAVDHGEQDGAHGDDHHAVARHKYAAITSIVGPLVLALSFGLAVAIWLAMAGADEMKTPYVQTFFDWMVTGRPEDLVGVPARSALDDHGARDHRRRHADSHLQHRLHARRPRLSAVLRVPESVRRLHAGARARRQLSRTVRGLGRRRTLLVPADRLLVQR